MEKKLKTHTHKPPKSQEGSKRFFTIPSTDRRNNSFILLMLVDTISFQQRNSRATRVYKTERAYRSSGDSRTEVSD